MAKKVRVEVNTRELKKVINSLTAANNYKIKVGILANKNAREDGETNAGIGIEHEYGSYTQHIPERSFIKMPLTTKSGEIVNEIKKLMQESLENQNVLPLLKKMGVVAEKIIGEAFASGGFGTWAPISESAEMRKGSNAILIETSQLQRSITSAVEKVR
jgi:hypothetical protein